MWGMFIFSEYPGMRSQQIYEYDKQIRMQLRESNFFATEIPSSQRYTIAQNENNVSVSIESRNKNPSVRIREAKSQAKKIVSIYNEALKQYLKVKNSIEKSNSKTHKLREQFVKLYSNKKSKYTNKSMLETKKQLDEEHRQEACNRVRTIKLSSDLGLMYTKNQCEVVNNRNKDENRKISQDLKKQLRVRKKEELDEAKQKFQQIKKGQTEFLIRKKNMSAIVSTRAHHNYLVKINHQMEMLENYTKLLDKVNQIREVDAFNSSEVDALSKTFFVTTKNSFN